MAVVFARLIVKGVNQGLHPFLVPLKNADGTPYPGVTCADCGHKLGLNGVDNARFWFNNVKIPRDNLLNKCGDVSEDGTYTSPISSPDLRFANSIGALVGGRVSMVLGTTQCAKIPLCIAIKYAFKRKQFGDPEQCIGHYLIHQRRLFPYLANIYAYNMMGHFIQRKFSTLYQHGIDTNPKLLKDVHIWAAGLKPLTSWNMVTIFQNSRECCGGMGFATINGICASRGSADAWLTFEGDNYVLLQQVSKEILKEFQHLQNTGEYSDRLVFIKSMDQKSAKFTEPLKNNSSNCLMSHDFQLWAFEYREQFLLTASSKALMESMASMNAFDAWNQCVDISTELAIAHTEREVLDRFQHEIDQVTNPAIGEVLSLLRSLFALWRINNEPSFLRMSHSMGINQDAVRAATNKLCQEIKPHATNLVDAFGIHAGLLGPIAHDYMAHFDINNRHNHY